MKTAISVPDETFRRASERASELGMSRSEFFTRAAQSYLDRLDAASLTDKINAALELGLDDDSAQAATASGRRRLAVGDDEW
ncbi:MAG: ribbon-helix-helix protein, CopG family [Mycobacteriales bacterium]